MDWTRNYEWLMRDLDVEPYSCFVTGCNHVARSTLGQLVHYRLGSHHMGHRRPADDARPIKSNDQRPDEEAAMAASNRRRLPIPTADEQADRDLTPEQKRELTIDTMASWALEGMEPDNQTVEEINAFLRSGLSASEYLRKLKGA